MVFIALQTILLGLSLSIAGSGYLACFAKLATIYRMISIFLNGVAIILEIVYFNNFQVCYMVIATSVAMTAIAKGIIALVCKKKYFYLLTSRILQLVKEQPLLKSPQELRNALVKKYDELYSTSDIIKVLKKI